MENLKSFYVIWRGDEDNFFVTRLDLDPLMMAPGPSKLNNQQVVQMCWDVEYGGQGSLNPYVGENCDSYEMIDIVSGDNITFHMS